jgi:hypothetical protein
LTESEIGYCQKLDERNQLWKLMENPSGLPQFPQFYDDESLFLPYKTLKQTPENAQIQD